MNTTVQQARAFFTVGETITVVENTYRPKLNGTARKITRVGAAFYKATTILDGREQKIHGDIPTRAQDIITLTDSELTCALKQSPQRPAGHTITYRKHR